jgi:polysaccharide biosynthesis protein PslG
MRNLITLVLLAVAIRAGAESVPRFGVNQDFVWTRDDQIPGLIQAIKDAHVQAVRISMRWTVVEPERAKWDFSKMDSVVHALHDAKIEILPTLMGVPPWASGVKPGEVKGFYDCFPPQRMEDWQECVRQVVTRYRKEIRFWEVWNEENGEDFYKPLPDAAQYVGILKTAHDTIKSIDPKAKVVLGGLQMNGIIPNPWSPVKIENFLQKIYDAGGRRYFDVVNIHPYVLATKEQGPAYAANLVRDTVRVMKKNGDGRKPLWITETGIATDTVTTEQMQADHLSGMYRELGKIPQVKAVYWFLLRDLDQAVCGGEDRMGVITAGGRRKPAFEALKKAATE